MIGITVFRDTKIIVATLKHILKHVPHGQVKNGFGGVMTQINNTFESKQLGESHDLMTLSVNKYDARTHNAQNKIGQYAIVMPPNG